MINKKKIIVFLFFLVSTIFMFLFIIKRIVFQKEKYVDVVINEIMTSNRSSIQDEDGSYSDWIELFNPIDKEISLKGYGISDDTKNPFKWIFPDITIGPYEYLVVYASGKDRRKEKECLHTNFKIKSKEETLIFISNKGKVLDEVKLEEATSNSSYGRNLEDKSRWIVFENPTPRKQNEIFYNNTKVIQNIRRPENFVTISILTDDKNLWDEKEGIYVMGENSNHKYPHRGANFWKNKEIPIILEFFDKKGIKAFAMNAGMKIFGGTTRALPQKSFEISARNKYGQSEINYNIFSQKDIQKFKSLILKNGGQDFDKTHFLDPMVGSLLETLNLDLQGYEPAVVYLNDYYWGIYNLQEKVDKDFLASSYGIEHNDIDLLENNMEVKEGSKENFESLITFVHSHDVSRTENYEYVKSKVDIDNFMDYYIGQIYIANIDWPHNNIRYWRTKTDLTKWRWIVYDTELSFQDYKHRTLEYVINGGEKGFEKSPSTLLFVKLLENKEFKEEFVGKFLFHIDSTFEPSRVINIIEEMQSHLKSEMQNHLDKWGGTMESWEKEVNKLREFAQKRPSYMKKEIEDILGTIK